MKATITIKGQVNGNFKIRTAIIGGTNIETNGGDYEIEFNTKKEAVQALNQAYKQLYKDDVIFAKNHGGMTKGKNLFYYDASIAYIR